MLREIIHSESQNMTLRLLINYKEEEVHLYNGELAEINKFPD